MDCFSVGSIDGCSCNGNEQLYIGIVKLSQCMPGLAIRAPHGRDCYGFEHNRRMKVLSFSFINTGRLYHQEIPLVLISVTD